MKHILKNPANHFAMLLLAAATAFAQASSLSPTQETAKNTAL